MQFQSAIIIKDDIETGYGNIIPLWYFGLNNLTIEIDAKDLNSVLDVLTELEDIYNVRVAIDSTNLASLNLQDILLIRPSFIKIDVELIKKMRFDTSFERSARMIKHISQFEDIETIALHIEDKATMDLAVSMGIHYFQGHYWGNEIAISELSNTEQLNIA